MGLFQSKRSKWAAVVMPSSAEDAVTDEMLHAATDLYIQQHSRILYDSINLFLTSKNKETKESRYELACKHYGALSKVRRFSDKSQRQIIDKTIDDFIRAEEQYRHPERIAANERNQQRQQNKEEFWTGVAQEEFFVDFMDDVFNKKK